MALKMKRIVVSITFILCTMMLYSQKVNDKAEADSLICIKLLTEDDRENWHPEFVVKKEMLKETNERNVYRVMGSAFQVKSVRSDFYVKRESGNWKPLFDSRYPVESLVNLLLAHIDENRHLIELRHHQYGNHIALMTIPMQRIHNLFGPDMQMYCRVATEGNDELKAWLVFYHGQEQYIHLLELKVPIKSLFVSDGIFYGDLYANIPQKNIKSIFGKENETNNKIK